MTVVVPTSGLYRRRRVLSVLTETITAPRFGLALIFAFIVRSLTFFAGMLVEIPAGWAGTSCLVVAWATTLLVPVDLPLESPMRSPTLLGLAIWPQPRGDFAPLPASTRLLALGLIVAFSAPLMLLLAAMPGAAAQTDLWTGWAAQSSPAFAVAYMRWSSWRDRRARRGRQRRRRSFRSH